MDVLKPEYYFDLSNADYTELFDGIEVVWNALKNLQDAGIANSITKASCDTVDAPEPSNIATVGSPDIRVAASAHVGPFVTVYGKGGGVLCIDKKATILPGTVITVGTHSVYIGPEAVIGPNVTIDATLGSVCVGGTAQIRQGSCVRQSVLLAEGAQVGICCEVKCSLLGRKAEVLHFNYVGDSLLGYKAHTGAGAKLSNYKLTSTTERPVAIEVKHEGQVHITGLIKFGSVMGDNSQLGSNSVANPGTLLGKNAFTYAGCNVRGIVPSGTIVKLRQTLQHDGLQ